MLQIEMAIEAVLGSPGLQYTKSDLAIEGSTGAHRRDTEKAAGTENGAEHQGKAFPLCFSDG